LIDRQLTTKGERGAFRALSFAPPRRQVIYLIAGFFVLASNCSIPSLSKDAPDWNKTLAKGYQQLAMGNSKEAAKFFSEKVNKNPNSGPCHTAYGQALKRLGKSSEAKAEFKSATELEPGFGDGFYEFGCASEGDKEYANAQHAFERYLELKPDEAQRKNIADRIRFCKDHQ